MYCVRRAIFSRENETAALTLRGVKVQGRQLEFGEFKLPPCTLVGAEFVVSTTYLLYMFVLVIVLSFLIALIFSWVQLL